MRTIPRKHESTGKPVWNLVRKGSHLVPEVTEPKKNHNGEFTAKAQPVSCVFVVTDETPCEVRVHNGDSKSAGKQKGQGTI